MTDESTALVATLLAVVLVAPLVAVLGCLLLRRPRAAEFLNLGAAIVVFAAVLRLLPLALAAEHTFWGGYLIVDPLGVWVLLSVASVYLLASLYAIGYMRALKEDARLHQFYALFAAFALTTLSGPLMNNIGVYWIAIELTTLVSTFLVCFELGRESIEAAWKYIVVVSGGISLALLGIILFYWGGSLRLGPTYDLTWSALREVAPQLNPTIALMAFLLAVIGFGTKVGLAPMHTWLPDAHSEGPAPVSAMLSGALLNTAMIGIARFIQISDAARLGILPRAVVVAIGAFSLLIAALFITRQMGIKRLMAYSSVEHMGVMALGFGFGGPLGIAGALYHMLGHSLNKSLMFFGAGNAMQIFRTRRISRIHQVLSRMPVSGVLWLAGAVAITGAPPFGLFLSEMTILRAGLTSPNAWAVFVMLILLIVIFIGFLNHFRTMYFGTDRPLHTVFDSPRPEGALEPLVRAADVAGAHPASRVGSVVAQGLRTLLRGRRHPIVHAGCGVDNGSSAVNVPRLEEVAPANLRDRCRAAVSTGQRMQMAYAWFPESPSPEPELRYLVHAGVQPLALWRCRPTDHSVPSLAAIAPLLSWYEREMADLCGLSFEDAPNQDPLVLLPGAHVSPPPLLPASAPAMSYTPLPPTLPEMSGRMSRDVQQLPFGPIRADVLESAQFDFYYIGEAILHYHPQLFFKHRGMEKRFEGLTPGLGAVLAERVSGVGSVAHSLAYCQAIEAAAACDVPARARWLRVLLAELERLYNHLHYLGHLCHTTTLKVGEAEGKYLEERAKQVNARASGNRLLRGLFVPGGLRRELDVSDLTAMLTSIEDELRTYGEMLEASTTHLDRLITTGILSHQLAFDQGATGPVERASGLDRDLRRDQPYAAYEELPPEVVVREGCDAHARQQVRIAEAHESIALIKRLIPSLPSGPVRVDCVPLPGSEGLGWAESPRGSLYYAVHVDGAGHLARVKVKSPSFSNWRVFAFTVHDSNMMDYAINEASFGLTIAGCDR